MTPKAATDSLPVSGATHIPILDGVRGVAVLIVICFHFWQGFTRGPYTIAGHLAVWGQTGVDLFFVLSGFLITRILVDSKGSKHFFQNFYIRRILRIFPLYYVTLSAIYLLGPLLGTSAWTPWKQSIWFWVYLQNIPMTFAPSLAAGPGHFWSLAVEEHYYLVWPMLVAVLDRKWLLRATLLAIGISLLTRASLLHYATFYFTLARLDGLAMGSALAILSRDETGNLSRFVSKAKWLMAALGIVLASTQLITSGSGNPLIQVFKNTLIALVYSCVLVLAVENGLGRPIGMLLSSRILRSVGKYSYAMYVIHPFVLGWLHALGLSFNFSGLLLSVFLTYSGAWLSWFLLEKRFLQLKRYFEYTRHTSHRVASWPLVGAVETAPSGGD